MATRQSLLKLLAKQWPDRSWNRRYDLKKCLINELRSSGRTVDIPREYEAVRKLVTNHHRQAHRCRKREVGVYGLTLDETTKWNSDTAEDFFRRVNATWWGRFRLLLNTLWRRKSRRIL